MILIRVILKSQLLLAVLLSQMPEIYSQSFNTRLYTTSDGLSDNYIFSTYQDSYGYLWIGTPNGLNRFDGKRFSVIGLKQGLPSLYVDRIYEDRHHRLWIGTRAGMAELKGDSCFIYPLNDKQNINFVSGFLETPSGKLWATTNKGLYELRDTTWIKISLYPGFENASIGKIISTSQGLYINYNNNKLIHRQLNGNWKSLLSVETNRPYYNNLFEKNDTVYISTYSGLKYWTGTKWMTQFEDTLKNKYIYSSYLDHRGRFWFGTKEDGVLVALQNEADVNYVHIPLSFNLVSGFFEDSEKNIWVAGFHGLLKVSPSPYNTVSMPGPGKTELIRNCIVMPSGRLLVSNEKGNLLIFQPANSAGHLAQLIAIRQLKNSNDFIDFHTFDEQQRMWFTTREGGFYRLDDTKLINLTSLAEPGNDGFRDLAYNLKTKQIYVCGDSVLFTGNENHLDTFFSNETKRFIPLPYTIHIEKEGSMLVQTIENGLYLVTKDHKVLPLGKKINLGLSIHDTAAGKNNATTLWAVTSGNEISRYRWNPGEPPLLQETINEKDGLSNNSILSLALATEQKLWIATTKGITVMQKGQHQQWIHQDFEISESGAAIPLSFTKLSRDKYDNIWINLRDKLFVVNSTATAIAPMQTQTVIEQILLYDRPTDWSLLVDSVESYRRLPVDPILEHNQNTLSIIFNGLQFSDNSQLEFSYRLEPSDTAWSSPIASNIVSFYQLTPGKYRFAVRSHVRGFEWSKPTSFSFSIKKPFWETAWFRVLIILLASALIVYIFRYRVKQLKMKTEVRTQLRELEMKALKAQMNPHFIHNALNSIQSLVLNNQTKQASHYISKFAKLLRQVFENADKNLISLDKELYSLQLYVELEKLRMNADIVYKEDIDENILLSEINIPPLILQPFVENALWHGLSLKEGDKRITISITSRDKWIICKITDNGIGRKKAGELNKSFPEGNLSKAIIITRQRLVDFNQSPGTEPISFVDLEKDNGQEGTTVIVRIKQPSYAGY
jgi:ligand-binding sensor domain-containing protein/two-component sensor histidine kinase